MSSRLSFFRFSRLSPLYPLSWGEPALRGRLSPQLSLRSRLRRGLFAITLLASSGGADAAWAWDPSTSHLQVTDLALREAAIHRLWMDDSRQQRGLFSPLRLNPAHLETKARAALEEAIEHSHQSAHAAPMGGPYSCPGPKAPLEAQRFCVQGALWEHDAFGWIHLGILLDAVPSYQLASHLVFDKQNRQNSKDSAKKAPRWFRRAQRRHNNAPMASFLTGSDPNLLFEPSSGWSLRQLPEFLEQSQTLPSPQARDEASAKSLILLGVLLHRLQDLTLPSVAHGDRKGFFSPLSQHSADRGNAMEAWSKQKLHFGDLRRAHERIRASRPDLFGTDLFETDPVGTDTNGPNPSSPAPAGPVQSESGFSILAKSKAGHKRDTQIRSLAQRFRAQLWSPSRLPAPRVVDPSLSPAQAAQKLLENHPDPLAPAIQNSLVLRGWPAQSGYLCHAQGVALAAYERDASGRVHLRLDPAVYAQQAPQLLVFAIELSRQLIDRFAQPRSRAVMATPADASKGISKTKKQTVDLSWRQGWSLPALRLVAESKSGQRRVLAQWDGRLPSDAAMATALAQAQTQTQAQSATTPTAPKNSAARSGSNAAPVPKGNASSKSGPAWSVWRWVLSEKDPEAWPRQIVWQAGASDQLASRSSPPATGSRPGSKPGSTPGSDPAGPKPGSAPSPKPVPKASPNKVAAPQASAP